MEELVYDTLTRYFRGLSLTGYKSYNTVYKILLVCFIYELFNSDLRYYITKNDVKIMQDLLYQLFGSTCEISFPTNTRNCCVCHCDSTPIPSTTTTSTISPNYHTLEFHNNSSYITRNFYVYYGDNYSKSEMVVNLKVDQSQVVHIPEGDKVRIFNIDGLKYIKGSPKGGTPTILIFPIELTANTNYDFYITDDCWDGAVTSTTTSTTTPTTTSTTTSTTPSPLVAIYIKNNSPYITTPFYIYYGDDYSESHLVPGLDANQSYQIFIPKGTKVKIFIIDNCAHIKGGPKGGTPTILEFPVEFTANTNYDFYITEDSFIVVPTAMPTITPTITPTPI